MTASLIPRCYYRYDHLHLLRLCKSLDSLLRIHARLVVTGASSDDRTLTHLLNSYASFGRRDSALSVFASSPNPTVVLWNSMIRAYAGAGDHHKAILFYRDMLRRGVEADKYTFTFVSKACAGDTDAETGDSIHREVVRRGMQGDVFIGTGLVDMYSKLGMMESARQVFESMPELDVVAYNAMISGFSQGGCPCEALSLFRNMQSAGVAPNSVTALNLFPAICELSSLLLCQAVHGFMTRRYIFRPAVFNGLIDAYSKCGNTGIARRTFDRRPDVGDDVSWGTMLSGYVFNGRFLEALELFDELKRENLMLNQVSVVSALSAAAEMGDLEKGVDIHDYVIQSGMELDVTVTTMLLTMYAKCGYLEEAKLLFDGMQHKDIVAWSAMVSAFVQEGQPEDAVSLFREMMVAGQTPSRVTIVSILPACGDLLDLKLGKSLHCYALKSSFCMDVSVGTALVAMYAQCRVFSSAHKVFDRLHHKDTVTWNALITGYAQIGDAGNALQMFHQLRSTGQRPDPGTMIGVLPACTLLSAIKDGSCVHGLIIKSGFDYDLHVKNAMIDMYAKCGKLSSAESLFLESNSCNDVISWNTLIAGYVHNGRAIDAISAFSQMRADNVRPNLVTLVTIIPATAQTTSLNEGMVLHSYVISTGFEYHVQVGNSLIDMYSKCGRLNSARDLFDHMKYRDVVSWNAMLAGYAIHGLGETAVVLFSTMKDSCIQADSVTIICVLSACRHGGLVEEGRRIFNSMRSEHRPEPEMEHYACMIDLLGRAGQFGEAWSLIQAMPMAPDATVWGALLGACRMHSNVRMGEIAQDHLTRLEPQNPAHYVVLSNIYAQAEKWDDAGNTREEISRTGLKKSPGCSWF